MFTFCAGSSLNKETDKQNDILGKEPHTQVGVGMRVTSGSLGGVMISTLAWNAKDESSIDFAT